MPHFCCCTHTILVPQHTSSCQALTNFERDKACAGGLHALVRSAGSIAELRSTSQPLSKGAVATGARALLNACFTCDGGVTCYTTSNFVCCNDGTVSSTTYSCSCTDPTSGKTIYAPGSGDYYCDPAPFREYCEAWAYAACGATEVDETTTGAHAIGDAFFAQHDVSNAPLARGVQPTRMSGTCMHCSAIALSCPRFPAQLCTPFLVTCAASCLQVMAPVPALPGKVMLCHLF